MLVFLVTVMLWWHWLNDVDCGGGGSLDKEVLDMCSIRYVSQDCWEVKVHGIVWEVIQLWFF